MYQFGDIYNEDQLNCFAEKNPLRFSEQRKALVRRDFYNHKRETVSDEFVDFVLWTEKSPARHEHFGTFLLPIIRDHEWKTILEVGSDETALLSEYLHHALGVNVIITAMDQCDIQCNVSSINLVKRKFTGADDILGFDAVIAQESCEATELIIKACTGQNVPYCVILCGVPHARLTGVHDDDVYAWYAYLPPTYPGSQFAIWNNGRFSSGCIYSENGFDKKYFQDI